MRSLFLIFLVSVVTGLDCGAFRQSHFKSLNEMNDKCFYVKKMNACQIIIRIIEPLNASLRIAKHYQESTCHYHYHYHYQPVHPRGDIFVLYCSHCLQQSSAFSLGREGGRNEPFYSSSLGSRLLSKYWPFCIHVLDSNMTFSERKLSLLKR